LAALGSAAALLAALYYWRAMPSYPLPRVPPGASANLPVRPATGPLRVLAANPRYFTDGSGRAVLLAGSHTWSNFQDNGFSDPPPVFDYESYLNFLVANNLNFFRLWAWEQSRWAPWVRDGTYFFSPGPPYRRTGPGRALDGKPRFDLDQLDPAYFERLRTRVQEAGRRGIYVSVMLFNGWSTDAEHARLHRGNPWQGHPFNVANNVNGVDGDPSGKSSGEGTHQLVHERITAYQEAYVRRVVDALADLDNVLYEISNESYPNSRDWQYHMIRLIHAYEAGRPKRHPVGMSQYEWPGKNADLFDSPADWIAPWEELPDFPYRASPPDTRGLKVVITDTDHLWGIGGDRKWAWKTFMRGNHPSFMDAYDGAAVGLGAPLTWDVLRSGWKLIVRQMLHVAEFRGWEPDAPKWVSLRANLGHIRRFADRMDLAHAMPDPAVASTGYALVHIGVCTSEYLVYAEDSKTPIKLDLSRTVGPLAEEWFDPSTGSTLQKPPVQTAGLSNFQSPFQDDAVLYLYTATGSGAAACRGK
jgi:hypothetical protein